jgi:uncharacterized lipoprotein YbaY/heat shock protein HslJ
MGEGDRQRGKVAATGTRERFAAVAAAFGLLAVVLTPACTADAPGGMNAGSTAGAAAGIRGTALVRDDLPLPPNAVFEATLEDVSRADAPSREMGRTRIENPGPPPISFSIAYDPAAIDGRKIYVVRARILADGRLLFTTDTHNPVLTRGASSEVTVLMRPVASAGGASAAPGATAPDFAAPGAAAQSLRRPAFVNGMFVYLADAARLTECSSGQSVPVAMEGDYLRLEQAYLEARTEPGQAIMVSFEGAIEDRPRMEGGGTEPTAIVVRFIHLWPGESCERNRTDAALVNTYWRIVKLGDEEIRAVDGRREPHLLLRTPLNTDEARFTATAGCNQISGGYQTDAVTLRLQGAASTRMACPPPLDRLERLLIETLAQVAAWRIRGQILELYDGKGEPVALLQAVYLR